MSGENTSPIEPYHRTFISYYRYIETYVLIFDLKKFLALILISSFSSLPPGHLLPQLGQDVRPRS